MVTRLHPGVGRGNLSAFGYTGQAWLPTMGIWYYKARIYDPQLGRFLQTDPAGGANLYAYVGNDPIGASDPSGMIREFVGEAGDDMSRFIDYSPQGVGLGHHSYDWSGQAAMSGAWAAATLSYMSNATGLSIDCLLNCSLDYIYQQAAANMSGPSGQFYPNTSISSGQTDPSAWQLSGETTISSGILVGGVDFNIGDNDQVQIETFSLNPVTTGGIGAGPAGLFANGSIQVNVTGCGWLSCTTQSYFVAVIWMQSTRSQILSVPRDPTNVGYPAPRGNSVTVLPTIMTPRDTLVTVRTR